MISFFDEEKGMTCVFTAARLEHAPVPRANAPSLSSPCTIAGARGLTTAA
jgi:hypothetical protein